MDRFYSCFTWPLSSDGHHWKSTEQTGARCLLYRFFILRRNERVCSSAAEADDDEIDTPAARLCGIEQTSSTKFYFNHDGKSLFLPRLSPVTTELRICSENDRGCVRHHGNSTALALSYRAPTLPLYYSVITNTRTATEHKAQAQLLSYSV